jgi:hypothetical protein
VRLAEPPEFDEEKEREALLEHQPGLGETSFTVTSKSATVYNCVAWAACDNKRVWSPATGPRGKQLGGYYWPDGVESIPAISAVEAVFSQLGFEPCDDGSHQPGVKKIAIYGDGMGMALHAARQTQGGRWASKMGDLADIEHDAPAEVESSLYGTVRRYMARRTKPAKLARGRQLLLPSGSPLGTDEDDGSASPRS